METRQVNHTFMFFFPFFIHFNLPACYLFSVLDMKPTTCQKPLSIKSGSTIISSASADTSGCGTTASPLIVETNPGQRINITMTDFSWGVSGFDINKGQCQRSYGHIVTYDSSDILQICGGSIRKSHVYTTSSHVIQIAFDETALQQYTFLLNLQGSIYEHTIQNYCHQSLKSEKICSLIHVKTKHCLEL